MKLQNNEITPQIISYLIYLSIHRSQMRTKDQTYDDGDEKLLTHVRYRSFTQILLMVLNLCLSPFYFGYTIQYLGTFEFAIITKVFNMDIDPDNLSFVQGIANGLVPIGAGVGAMTSFILIKKLSRRNSLLFVNCLALAFGVLIMIKTPATFFVSRFMQGVCTGFYSAIAPLIIKQFSPTQIAGTLGTFNQLLVGFGVFFACLLQFVLKKINDNNEQAHWFIMFGFTLITVAIQSVLLLVVFRFETPKYLLQKNRQQDCRKVLQWIYHDQFVEEVLAEKKSDLGIGSGANNDPYNKQSVASQNTQNQITLTSPNKRNKVRLFVSVHLAMLQQFVGINAVVIYGTKIAGSVLPDLKNVIPVVLNLEQTLACLVTSYLLTRLGRKQILQAGTAVSVLSLLMIGIGFFIKISHDDSSFANGLILTGLVVFMANFGLSLGPIVWLYIPEILQPDLISVSTLANWASASLITFLFPVLEKAFGTCAYLFLFYAVYSTVGFFISQKFVIETKGKTEKQIYKEYEELAA